MQQFCRLRPQRMGPEGGLDGRKFWVEKHPENLEEIQRGLRDARGFVALRAVVDLIVTTNPQVAGYGRRV